MEPFEAADHTSQARAAVENDLFCSHIDLLQIERDIKLTRLQLHSSGKNMAQQSRIDHLLYELPSSWQTLCSYSDSDAILDRCEEDVLREQAAESQRLELWKQPQLDVSLNGFELAKKIIFSRLNGL